MRFSQLPFEEYSVIQWLNPDLSEGPAKCHMLPGIRENWEIQDFTELAIYITFPIKKEEIPRVTQGENVKLIKLISVDLHFSLEM